MKKQKFLIFMSLPFVIWIIVFKYLPLSGWTMAFQDYKPGKSILNIEHGWVSNILRYYLQNHNFINHYKILLL